MKEDFHYKILWTLSNKNCLLSRGVKVFFFFTKTRRLFEGWRARNSKYRSWLTTDTNHSRRAIKGNLFLRLGSKGTRAVRGQTSGPNLTLFFFLF